MIEDLMAHLEDGDYSYVLSSIPEANNSLDTVETAIIHEAAELQREIDSYINSSRQEYINSLSVRSTLAGMFSSSNNFSNHPMHEQYFKMLENRIHELTGFLDEAVQTLPAFCSDISRIAVQKLLNFPATDISYLNLSMDADDIYCRPLLKYIDKKAISIVLKNYLSCRNRHMLLPKQKELAKYMKQLAK